MIEIRIPTYKRPQLLRRALESLLKQSYEDWKAIIRDDSPDDQETEKVVKELNDPRIFYQKNKTNLGHIGNQVLCYSATPFFEGSSFACVLEDDNYYREHFLKNAVLHLNKYKVFLGNAQIAQLYDNGREVIQDRFNLSPIYGEESREITYKERLTNVPYNTVIGNLCLVWRLHEGINLEIKEERYNAAVQEKMRGLAYRGIFIYDPTPNAIFTNFPERVRLNTTLQNRRWRRSRISLTRCWYKELINMGINYKSLPNQETVRKLLLEGLIINHHIYPNNIKELDILLRSIILLIIFPYQSDSLYKHFVDS
jgi:glycosyltransferase involved in cell wall biosynthesis